MSKNGSYTKRSDVVTFETNDFDKFHKADYNRGLNNNLVKKLEKSIKEYGYIGGPIIVNEFYEVVDGQHRLQACKNTNTPVLFSRVPGLTQKHFIALNLAQKPMSLDDYISSHAGEGNENYIKLSNLKAKYPMFSNDMFVRACHSTKQQFKEQKLKISDNEYMFIDRLLAKVSRYHGLKKEVFNNREKDLLVIYRLLESNLVDDDRLFEKLSKHGKSFYKIKAHEYDIVGALQDIYNRNNRAKAEYFSDKYKEAYPIK